MFFKPIVLLILGVSILWFLARQLRRRRQTSFIEKYFFHKGIRKKLTDKHPYLDDSQLDLVFCALRDYFHICHQANKKMVAMPSQVVDDAWHEFILSTRFYERFCQKAFGRFLHHTPTEAMKTPTLAQDGIKRAWRLACAKEKINPKTPSQLPLLFAIDAMLRIENGFVYTLNCQEGAQSSDAYCASHIGCSAGCAGDFSGDNSDSGSDSSCGSDCGGGCGGGD